MGRKIPGRKHRGIRDPEKQRQLKLSSLAGKVDAPPTNKDDQETPKSLIRIMELKDQVKNGKPPPKPKVEKKVFTRMPYKPVPKFEQKRNESDKQFMFRVNRVCQSVIREKAFEEKYGVDIKRNPETGRVEEVVKQKKDELQQYIKQIKKEDKLKGKKKKKNGAEQVKLTKAEKRKLKLKEKKAAKNVEEKDFSSFTDSVGFGEIVHAPPTLTFKGSKSNDPAPRPGTKNLILKSLMGDGGKFTNHQKPETPESHHQKTMGRAIDKKGKRKDLPHALRRQLDRQQSEVIKAYKELKKKKGAT